jgi:seryl-tRNA synthetase
MLDIKFIRENLDLVKMGAVKKRIKIDLDALVSLDDTRRTILTSVEGKKAEQNRYSQEIVNAKDDTSRNQLISEMKLLKEEIGKEEEELKLVMGEWHKLMVQVPNVPDISVPEGDDDGGNREVRMWGDIPQFSFSPRTHVDLMLLNGLADFERGTKVAGFRGYFLKGNGARLLSALIRFTEDRFHAKPDFTPMFVPSMVRREPFLGTGYLPQSEEDLYKTQDGEYLAGTAEVASMGYYMDEVIDAKELPIKFFSWSPCFRREAGSHGKDTKGVFRIHEFMKFEQVVLCEANHQESVRLHEEITANAEALLQELKLSYHVVVNCGGDLGLGQVKKYDIEAWMPSENRYRETHSASYFHDFQTRRLNIRYRDAQGVMRFAHSLNNTALAMPRVLCQIVENYQHEDASITIPDALVPYMGGITRIEPKLP